MITVKMNRSGVSLSAKVEEGVEKAKQRVEPQVKNELYKIAADLVRLSPVWSGAYVTSHSFVPKGSGGGRMRKSQMDKGPVEPSVAKNEAENLLINDINSVDIMEAGGGVFRNRSPHARQVEDGGVAPATGNPTEAWDVYRTAKAWASSRKSVT